MDTNEIWKDVQGYEGYYQVSNLGQVRSLDRIDGLGRPKLGKMLKLKMHKYVYVDLHKNGHAKRFSVSRLVAQAFHPNPSNWPEVNHKDENRYNNRADNLEWCTRMYNQHYGTGIKRMAQAHDYKNIGAINAKRLSKPVIATHITTGETLTFLSTRDAERNGYGNQTNISRCCRGLQKQCRGYVWQYAQ